MRYSLIVGKGTFLRPSELPLCRLILLFLQQINVCVTKDETEVSVNEEWWSSSSSRERDVCPRITLLH